MTCYPYYCTQCGDLLIHSGGRGANESSSAFGQHIHDDYPTTFYYTDIDAVIYKRATRILRVIEHKEPGKLIKPSQQSILPLIALGLDVLVNVHHLDGQSGVFAVWSDPPFTTGTIARIGADTAYKTGKCADIAPDQFEQFKTGEVVR